MHDRVRLEEGCWIKSWEWEGKSEIIGRGSLWRVGSRFQVRGIHILEPRHTAVKGRSYPFRDGVASRVCSCEPLLEIKLFVFSFITKWLVSYAPRTRRYRAWAVIFRHNILNIALVWKIRHIIIDQYCSWCAAAWRSHGRWGGSHGRENENTIRFDLEHISHSYRKEYSLF